MGSSSTGRRLGTFLWILSFLLMLGAGVYQRLTGPTHPMRVAVEVGDEERTMRLVRAAWTDEKARIAIPAIAGVDGGVLSWRRYPTDDAWTELALAREGEEWVARLPIQPAAGKLEYWVDLAVDGRMQRLPAAEDGQAVLRYRDPVPLGVLIPHIAFMFFGVLIAWRAGLGAIAQPVGLGRLAWWAFGLFTIGGMILGPIVQKYAFGEYWTGIPFGWDLTDNKTLVMWLAWLIAAMALSKMRPVTGVDAAEPQRSSPAARGLVLLAAIVTVGVYLIPHSVQGSELDYEAIEQGVPAEEAIGIG
ncbi:MAG: hypothetical protein M8860_08545 [marine benthic group bacterium]|jgi:hypothetical protein|nr:hypothetical protein [Gemmatimonadota bacterium]MCL7962882.1 hypothetical protein [Candidatus Carthagonibacter metallireducens]MCL7968175.1 hypothetical protein [Gemmatimonadota bacterium]MCL7973168.1 hypothetical protein [Gemmatimonadota bacterium]MCL7982884.1 hypothetical protein [Gemmatimonadota bacterium]